MAYSPSPQPGGHGPNSIFSSLHHASITPPLPQALSKRDKRRNVLSERLNDISANFAQNRDAHYRSQLQGIQLAMNFISNTEPYGNQPLNDSPDYIHEELSAALADNAQRIAQAGSRSAVTEVPTSTDRWAAAYVKQVNDEMEMRDSNLTMVANKYNDAIDFLSRDAEYQVELACKEHEQLVNTIRERIYQVVQKRKLKLSTERDTLDVTDNSTTSLFQSGHFTINHPTSPGAAQTNIKTRYQRHKLEVQDGGLGESNKKKRKAQTDTENGSPTRAIDSDTNFPWKEANAKLEAHSVTPTLELTDLFTNPELIANVQRAGRFAVQKITPRWRSSANKAKDSTRVSRGKRRAHINGNASGISQSPSSSDTENSTSPPSKARLALDPPSTEDALLLLEAPLMDRTANSSYHATRSTAILPTTTNNDLDFLEPGEVIGRRAAIPLLGLELKLLPRKRDEEYLRAPVLSESERDNDRAAMTSAIEQLENGTGGRAASKTRATRLEQAVREKMDHIAAAEALTEESSLRETLTTHSSRQSLV